MNIVVSRASHRAIAGAFNERNQKVLVSVVVFVVANLTFAPVALETPDLGTIN